MNNLDDFNRYLLEQVNNHSIYVWGAQGQNHTIISGSWIRARETSRANAERAIAFWKKQVAAGYGLRLRAFDSGLPVSFLCVIMLLISPIVNPLYAFRYNPLAALIFTL